MARGINKETRAGNIKKFKPSENVHDGLSLVILDSVEVTKAVAEEDSKQESFRGEEVPRITFVFKEFTKNENPAFYYHSYNSLEQDKKNTALFEDAMFEMINHFIQGFGYVLTDDDYKSLELNVSTEDKPSETLKAYLSFFNGVANVFNKGAEGKAIFKTDKDAFIPAYLKLLLYSVIKGKVSPINRGDAGLQLFPGDGVFEVYKKDVKPSISINIAKGESITPKAVVDATTAPVGGGGTAGAGAPIMDDDIPDELK